MAEQRVVITGIGAVTPNGLDLPTTWESVRQGRSGIGPITLFDCDERFRVRIAGEVHGFDPRSCMGAKGPRRTDRFTQLAAAAADEAVRRAELVIGPHNAPEIGVCIGSSAGGIGTYVKQQVVMDERGPRHLHPMLVPMIVIDAAAVQVGIQFGVQGPNVGVASACSTSADAIGLALETIRRGDASVMLAGGTDAAVTKLAIGGFDRLGSLSHRNDDPTAAVRPFDSGRDGFVLSEGSVVMVLESLEHATERGVRPVAELLAYASNSDGLHLTAPDESGETAARCLKRALTKAGVAPEEVDHINAHAPGTPLGDRTEAKAIRHVFGASTDRVAVSSTKSVTGHLLGAAGALACALEACALRDGVLPPTINLVDPDPDCDLNHVANVARPADARIGLVPSYGFGGHNACLVLRKI